MIELINKFRKKYILLDWLFKLIIYIFSVLKPMVITFTFGLVLYFISPSLYTKATYLVKLKPIPKIESCDFRYMGHFNQIKSLNLYEVTINTNVNSYGLVWIVAEKKYIRIVDGDKMLEQLVISRSNIKNVEGIKVIAESEHFNLQTDKNLVGKECPLRVEYMLDE